MSRSDLLEALLELKREFEQLRKDLPSGTGSFQPRLDWTERPGGPQRFWLAGSLSNNVRDKCVILAERAGHLLLQYSILRPLLSAETLAEPNSEQRWFRAAVEIYPDRMQPLSRGVESEADGTNEQPVVVGTVPNALDVFMLALERLESRVKQAPRSQGPIRQYVPALELISRASELVRAGADKHLAAQGITPAARLALELLQRACRQDERGVEAILRPLLEQRDTSLLTEVNEALNRTEDSARQGAMWAAAGIKGEDDPERSPEDARLLMDYLTDKVKLTPEQEKRLGYGDASEAVQEPNPEEEAFKAWAKIEVVTGKFPGGWTDLPRHCEWYRIPLKGLNVWLDPIRHCMIELFGKPIEESTLVGYLFGQHHMPPEEAAKLRLDKLAEILRRDCECKQTGESASAAPSAMPDKGRPAKPSTGSEQQSTNDAQKDALLNVEGQAPEPADAPAKDRLELVPGGFRLHGVRISLSGKPLAILKSLFEARFHTMTAADLLKEVWTDESLATAQNVKDAVHRAREAIRAAYRQAGKEPPMDDPIPCVDKGRSLAWKLVLSGSE